MRDGGLFFSSPRIFSDERDNGFVPMSFDRSLLTYAGGRLTEVASRDKFSTNILMLLWFTQT